LQLYIGCSGWSYDAWLDHFYPSRIEKNKFLEYYSSVFDYVEIDSSFYRTPNLFIAKRWTKTAPDNFRFTAKMPRSITHEKRLGVEEAETDLRYFFQAMQPLKNKLLCILIQLPPSLTAKEGFKKLEALIHMLDSGYRYAIEFRHRSWFDNNNNDNNKDDDIYSLLTKNNICMAWNQLDIIQTPPELTTDFFYLRLIGDRSIDEKDFGRIQKDRINEMQEWARNILEKNKDEDDYLKFGIVAANNHYAGFGPATANNFRKMLGLNEVVWEEMKQGRLI
jgi:uncharacterized protein YecE (DUF72 family)